MTKVPFNDLLPYIIKDYNVAAVLLGGSTTLRLNTENSDLDLVAVLDNSTLNRLQEKELKIFENQIPEYLYYDKKLIHWYYDSPDCFSKSNCYHFDLWAIEAAFGYSLYDNVLYLQNKVTLMNYLQALKNYVPSALDSCIKRYKHLIESIVQADTHTCGNLITKEIYHLCVINTLFKKGYLTEEDKAQALQIKQYAKQNTLLNSKQTQNTYNIDTLIYLKQSMSELLKNTTNYKLLYKELKDTLMSPI